MLYPAELRGRGDNTLALSHVRHSRTLRACCRVPGLPCAKSPAGMPFQGSTAQAAIDPRFVRGQSASVKTTTGSAARAVDTNRARFDLRRRGPRRTAIAPRDPAGTRERMSFVIPYRNKSTGKPFTCQRFASKV